MLPYFTIHLKRPCSFLLRFASIRWNSTANFHPNTFPSRGAANTHSTDTRFKYFSYPHSPRPHSPSFYTGNPHYYDFLVHLRLQMTPQQHSLIDAMEHQLSINGISETEEGSLEDLNEITPLLSQLFSAGKINTTTNGELDYKDTSFFSWTRFIPKETFQSKWGLSMTNSQYQRLICHLHVLDPHPLVTPYYSEKVQQAKRAKVRTLDADGKAFARGRRKTSLAHVHVVRANSPSLADMESSTLSSFLSENNKSEKKLENEIGIENVNLKVKAIDEKNDVRGGKFMVNGYPLADYFATKPRLAAIYPLQLARAFEKFNVWAVVEGGGSTGQSEAIAHGLAKALVIHEPSLEPKFKALGLLDMDLRLVERKKYGQKKARKKFTWVKR